jgi:DNA-binding NarL/FixJ family response regulator
MEKVRIVVADDQNLFREMMISFLNQDPEIEVTGEATSGEETLQQVRALRPDVVLLDIVMPDIDGIEVTKIIKKEFPETKVVLLTGYHQEKFIFEALQMGASGYLSKDSSADQVKEAVRTAMRGESLLEPKITTQLIHEFVKLRRTEKEPFKEPRKESAVGSLTAREREILALIAKGKSNQEISTDLFISEYTVKTHISNLFRKLNLNDRVQAVLFALENGIR